MHDTAVCAWVLGLCWHRFLSVTLALLFFAFCEESENVVPFDQFSTGFSILGGGSKSDKLSAGFRLFDDDEDGSLNRKQARGVLMALSPFRCS